MREEYLCTIAIRLGCYIQNFVSLEKNQKVKRHVHPTFILTGCCRLPFNNLVNDTKY